MLAVYQTYLSPPTVKSTSGVPSGPRGGEPAGGGPVRFSTVTDISRRDSNASITATLFMLILPFNHPTDDARRRRSPKSKMPSRVANFPRPHSPSPPPLSSPPAQA